MSSFHNNAPRHRHFLKKRLSNEFNVDSVIEKRSPQLPKIGVTPDVPPNTPTTPPTDPSNPTGGGNNNPSQPGNTNPGNTNPGNGNNPGDTNSHAKPQPTPPTQQPHQPVPPPPHTSQSTPQVPVNPTSISSSTTTTTSTSTTSSTTLSSTTTSFTPPPPTTLVAPTNQLPTTASVPTTLIAPSFTDGLVNTAVAPTDTGTGTPGDSGSLGTGSIVGIVAASLVAVTAVFVVGLWITKRYFKKREEAEFNRDSFVRQSVHIPDDDDGFRAPRPPTMIERHRGAHSPQPNSAGFASGGYGPGGVPPMPSLQHAEMMMANQAPVANPFAATPVDHYGQQQPVLVRVTSNGSAHRYSGEHGSPMSPQQDMVHGQYFGHNMGGEQVYSPTGHVQGYADVQRTSVTPYQAAQYAEISRQLNIPSDVSSPVSPAFAQGQNYGHMNGYTGSHADLSIDTGRLPTPAPPGPQRVMSPSIPVGGYSFPMPLNSGNTSLPAQAPPSVAHAAAMAALGGNAPRVTSPAHVQAQSAVIEGAPTQGQDGHLRPQAQGAHAGNNRPATMYNEEDAYDGM